MYNSLLNKLNTISTILNETYSSNMVDSTKSFSLLFEEEQIKQIVRESIGEVNEWQFVKAEVSAAADEVIGFLGEHLRALLYITVNGCTKQIHVFVKRVPRINKVKAKFIQDQDFFKREATLLTMFKNMEDFDESHPWHTKPFICNENIIVMPDLALNGYKNKNRKDILDLKHLMVATTSLARFHAAIADYETAKIINTNLPNPILVECGKILNEVTFASTNSEFLKSVAKLTLNLVNEFSAHYKISGKTDMEDRLLKLFIQACGSLKEQDSSLNVLLHKDLWTNNIMFKYSENEPISALFIDFQCVRYGPPAFDLMLLLYMNTFRSFREQNAEHIMKHYFSTFLNSINILTNERIEKLKYDFEHFRKWCDNSRMFVLLVAISILPYSVMESVALQKTLNDPDKFVEYLQGDRSQPVIAYAKQSCHYKKRLLEVCEEFLERYVDDVEEF